MADSTVYLVFAALGIVLIGAAIAAISMWRNAPRRRNQRLKEKFGPEYEVAVERYGAARAARILETRARRVEQLPLRSLSSTERVGFAQSWQLAEEQFVDAPSQAVHAAHELVRRIMHARGYPVEDVDQSVADLSVEHAGIVHHYRAAHALDQANREGRVDTEELRQALVHYRALFEELLGSALEQPPPPSRRPNDAGGLGDRHILHRRRSVDF